MKIGATNDPREDLCKELEWIGKSGFDFVDLTVEPPNNQPKDIDVQRARKTIQKYKLGVVGHIGDWRLPRDSPFAALREGCKIEIINAMRVLKRLGAKKITTHSFKAMESDYESAEKYCFELYKELLKEAKKLNVFLMVENGAGSYAYNPDNRKLFKKLFERFPALKMHIDVGHANLGVKQNRTGDFFSKYGKRIIHIHFSDNYGKNDNHLTLGAGRVSWKKIIKTLKRYKYDGTITLETFRSGRKGTLESKNKLKKWWAMY